MPVKFAMVCEGPTDFPIASTLVERVLCERHVWLTESLPHCSLWLDVDREKCFLTWVVAKRLADQYEIPFQGRFEGEKANPDAKLAWRAMVLLKLMFRQRKENLKAVFLIRDLDNQPLRREGLEQARKAHEGSLPVVVGVSMRCVESWILNGFLPDTTKETVLLESIRKEVGFDPTIEPHKLNGEKGDKRHPKSMLAQLTADSRRRQEKCWTETPLEILRTRGDASGLGEYLKEVKQRISDQCFTSPN